MYVVPSKTCTAVPLSGVPPVPRTVPDSVTSTVTVKVALTLLGVSSESLAVQVTVVGPIENVEPEAGAQVTVGAGLSSSTAVGGV